MVDCPTCGLPAQTFGNEVLCCNCGLINIIQRTQAAMDKIRTRLAERTKLGTIYIERWCVWILIPFIFLELTVVALINPTYPQAYNGTLALGFGILTALIWTGYVHVESVWRTKYSDSH